MKIRDGARFSRCELRKEIKISQHIGLRTHLRLPGEKKTAKFDSWSSFILVRTKKHHTESIRFVGPPAAIERLRKLARETGVAESIPASMLNPELDSNPGGVYLKGIRHLNSLSQEQLAKLAGIPRRHISKGQRGRS